MSTTEEAIIYSLRFMENLRIIDADLIDTFPTFALKVSSLKLVSCQAGVTAKIKFKGVDYNSHLHRAVSQLSPLLSEEAFVDVLSSLEVEFGKELLSNSYSKLLRFTGFGAKVASTGPRSLGQASALHMEFLLLELRSKRVLPKNVTEAWLEKHPKHGTPGFLQVAQVKVEAWGS